MVGWADGVFAAVGKTVDRVNRDDGLNVIELTGVAVSIPVDSGVPLVV